MILAKPQCIDCPPLDKPRPIYSKKRCRFHYFANYISENKTAKKNSSKSWVNLNVNREENTALKNYFDYHIENTIGVCENCGEPLYWQDYKTAKSCQAHIIPKKLFKSVQGNIHNHLSLGGLFQECSCHGQYDSNWKNAENMPVIVLVKQRFQLFKNEIFTSEYRLLPPFLYEML